MGGVLIEFDWVLIECRLRVSIKGVDRHSTTDAFSTHSPYPAYLKEVKLLLTMFDKRQTRHYVV